MSLSLTDQQEIDIINKVQGMLPNGAQIMDYEIINQKPYKPGKACQIFQVEVMRGKETVYLKFNARKLLREIRNERYDKQAASRQVPA